MKYFLTTVLLMLPWSANAEWIKYAAMGNGDVHFFDNTRIEKNGNLLKVWNRVRYKSSVMGASSYQSLMKINCSEHTKIIVQNTFYTDRGWQTPAMATDTKEKPKVTIKENTATDLLTDILCK